MKKARLLLLAAIAGALVLAGLGTAARQSETYKLSASLNVGQEVPKPTGVPRGASGKFTGTTVEKNDKVKLTWRLTWHGLSGKAVAAHIHLAKRGKAGPVKVALCAPCTSGAHGTATIESSLEKSIEAGKTYVNIHTAKNKDGEIRGQLKAVES
jgi:CHRD domain